MESKKAFGAVAFDVSCLERTLFVLIPEKYVGKEKEILECCEKHMTNGANRQTNLLSAPVVKNTCYIV